jgi:hypothetical protein
MGIQRYAGGIGGPIRTAAGIDLRMNLRNLNKIVSDFEAVRTAFGQSSCGGVLSCRLMNSVKIRFATIACIALTMLFVSIGKVSAQTNYYAANGTEYAAAGLFMGDQVFSDVAISPSGGYLVWQDNITDGDGWGISAERVDATQSGTFSTFRVNSNGASNQEFPRVAMLKNGGAVFVWQGGVSGSQKIYCRFITSSNTFLNPYDLQVNSFTNHYQANPAVAVLNNGNVVIVWGSFDEAGSNSMQDVYGQILSPAGQKVGGEFLVNQFSNYNQRTPAVTALAGGGFAVAWQSEQQVRQAAAVGANSTYVTNALSLTPSADIYARIFDSSASPITSEFLVDTDSNPCANPQLAATTDGNFMVVWSARDLANFDNDLDVYGRVFNGAGQSVSAAFKINTYLYGDQYAPHLASLGLEYLVTWTSLMQDGSREGVFGQFVHANGTFVGSEFRVNTTTAGSQTQPAVASDGANNFLVTWSSFTGTANGFDIFAQRYANTSAQLNPMPAPFVWVPFLTSNNIYQPQLVVSWSPLAGIALSNYEIFVDGVITNPVLTVSNVWIMTAANGLTTNSTHSFAVDYVTTDGRRPGSLSPATSATTWSGLNWGGIPYEWMAAYFGGYSNGKYTTTFWPPATSNLGGGVTLYKVFLSGGSPLDSNTWLQTQLQKTQNGLFLSWNTQPGGIYQVQLTTNFVNWSNFGSPRFAAGNTDSIYVGGSTVGYYRVVLLR